MQQTLLLDSRYYPIQIIDWKKALTLFFTDRAEVVEEHESAVVNSTHATFKLPKVMRLHSHMKILPKAKFNRKNVFYRDKFTCQYCGHLGKEKDLTLDHIMPRSRGGTTSWLNIVTACEPCNIKKADKLLEHTSMHLLKEPYEPLWMSLLTQRLTMQQKDLWSHWFFNS